MNIDGLSHDEKLFIIALRLAYMNGDKNGYYNGTLDNIRIERDKKSPILNITFNWGDEQQFYQRVSLSYTTLEKVKI